MATIELGVTDGIARDFKGRLTIHPEYVDDQRSRCDFFKICRQVYQDGKSVRIYMAADGREIEGASYGVVLLRQRG